MPYLYSDLTYKINNAYFKVFNMLGTGFLEKVYERALLIELRKRGLKAEAQVPITVYYEGEEVGIYYVDILVENKVIVEAKATRETIEEHEAPLINYLQATEIEVGLLLNFGIAKPAPIRRIVTNDQKNWHPSFKTGNQSQSV